MTGLWPYIAAAGAAILALIGVYVKGQSAGSTKERAKQLQERQEARDVADEVDADIGMLTPDAKREALKKWSKS